MQSDIEKIINDGVQAPSGENCQPWKFVLDNNKLSIFNVPEADLSLYNSKQKGSYMSHGALLENMAVSAAHYGYSLDITLFPTDSDETHVADVTFEESPSTHRVLYSAISKRCTNRKEYTGEKLSAENKKELIDAVESLGFDSFKIVDGDEEKLHLLGIALATNERVLFENRKLHDFFYDHILWDKKDEDKAGGFYIDTLEFLPHQLKGVKLFKHWSVLKILNKILGVSKMISKENGEKYAKSGSFGAVIMKGNSNADYVRTGMSMQRVWLTAAHLGIDMHPCNGTLYLKEHIQDSGSADFSLSHREMIETSSLFIRNAFEAGDSPISFIFRMGKGDAPTARAKRLPAVIHFAPTTEN